MLPSDIHTRVFLSHAEIEANSIEAASIYLDGHRQNLRRGITSYLHRQYDTFLLQVEGPIAEIEGLTTRMRRDWRHSGLTVLHDGIVSDRVFGGWPMACCDEGTVSFDDWARADRSETRLDHAAAPDLIRFCRDAVRRLGAIRDEKPHLFPKSEIAVDLDASPSCSA